MHYPVCHPPSAKLDVPARAGKCRRRLRRLPPVGAARDAGSLRWANLVPLDDPTPSPSTPHRPPRPTSDSHPVSPPGLVEPAALALPTAFRGGIPLDRRRLVGAGRALYWVETSPPTSLGLSFGNDRAIVGLLGQHATATTAAGALPRPCGRRQRLGRRPARPVAARGVSAGYGVRRRRDPRPRLERGAGRRPRRRPRCPVRPGESAARGTVKRLSVEITLLSPLALATRRARRLAASLQSTSRALASAARSRGIAGIRHLSAGPPWTEGHCADATCEFSALFAGPTAVRFLDALPLEATDLLPATAVSCIRWPGFRSRAAGGSAGDPSATHGVYDTLLDRACWEILAPAGLLYVPRCAHPGCGRDVERYRGYYARRAVGGSQTYVAARPPAGLLARAAVDRDRRVAHAAGIHTVGVLYEAYRDGDAVRPTTFRSEVLVPDDARAASVADLLQRIDSLGGGRSRGLGAVHIAVRELPAPEPLGDRLERFSRAWSLRKTQYARLAPLSAASLEGAYFAIDLRSDAILRRDDWLPTMRLDAGTCCGPPRASTIRPFLVRAYTTRLALAAGRRRGGARGQSRPLSAAAAPTCIARPRWRPGLAHSRRSRRRGSANVRPRATARSRVCDPFHLLLRERAV